MYWNEHTYMKEGTPVHSITLNMPKEIYIFAYI